jgi:N-acetylmuramic acid 6-phosphate etherase
MLASGADEAAARAALAQSGQQVKLAIVMLKAGVDAPAAEALLSAAQGSIRTALAVAGAAVQTGEKLSR